MFTHFFRATEKLKGLTTFLSRINMRIKIPNITFVVIAVFITCGICQEKHLRRDIGDALKSSTKTYLVNCEGKCRNIKATIEVDTGDPDLFASEHHPPQIGGETL